MSDVSSRLAAALAGKYRVEHEIGAGGMATVYLAHDLKHDRDVAIKVLHPDLGAALGGERFLTEIRTTARLQHPHILPLLDSGDAGHGLLYYVMPLVSGETLRARLTREKQLPIDDAVQIAREVADALQHAHVQNVIHRDIKPENILLQGGHALVADFGIALAVQSAGGARMTQTGLSLGTPGYMSPEQAMGERTIDARSDIYALGAVTYEMLTGEPPFTGATMQAIVAKVVNAEPERPSLTRKMLSPSVEHAVLKALAKLPADRFASAAAFSDALKVSSGESRDSRGLTVAAQATQRTRLDWRGAVAGLALGTAAMYGAVRFGIVPNSGALSSSSGVFKNTQVTFSGQVALPALSPSGDVLAYVRGECEQPGRSAFSAGNIIPCHMSLVVQDSGSTTPVTVLTNVPSISAVRWSSDGTTLFISAQLDSLREGLFAIPRLGGVARRIGPLGVFDVQANGDTILLLPQTADRETTQHAHFVLATTGAITDSIAIPMSRASAIAWSPNGKHIVFSNSTKLVIINRDGTLVDSVSIGLRPNVRWTTDGTAVLGFGSAPGRDDEFVRFSIKSDGHFTGDRAVILPRLQTLYRGDFDIARRTGRMALITGNGARDQWTFDVTPAGASTARQITHGTTYYAEPELAPDGRTLYYLRGDAIGDNLYSATLGQSSGAETAMSAASGTGYEKSTHASANGRRVVYRTSLGPGWAGDSNSIIFELDGASRQTRIVGGSLPWFAVPIGTRGFVGPTVTLDSIFMVDSTGAAPRIIIVPDSIHIIDFAVSPDETHMVVQTTGKASSALGIIDLTGTWNFRVIARFNERYATARLSWSADGNVYFPRWLRGDNAPKLFRVSSAGGPVVLVMTLPQRCALETVVVAAAAPVGACQVQDTRSDV